jgi:O-antigen ligase
MFYKLSKFFLYLSLVTPLLLIKSMFFPFIAGKAIFFRGTVELALLFFLFHILAHLGQKEFVQSLVKKLKHPIIICLAIFTLAIIITAVIGVNPTQSFWSNFERGDGAFQILHYAIFGVLTVLLFTEKKSLERLLIVNIAVSIPMCLYALLQLVTTNPNSAFVIAPGPRVSGTLGNPSYLAAYLIFILVFVIYFFLKNKDIVWRTGLAALFLFEFFILLKTGTRGAFLAIIAGMLVIAAINFFIRKEKNVRLTLGIIFAAIIGLSGTFFATHKAALWTHIPVLNRLVNFTSATTDIKPRLWTWGSGLAATMERPLFGWGVEGFATPFDKYYNPNHYGIESFFDRTHNIFLEYSVSGGLLVLLPWLAIFYFYYRGLRRRPKDFWYSILFTVPIMYLIQGFFLFDTLPIYLIFFTFLAFIINTETETIHFASHPNAKIQGVNIATAGLLVVGLGMLMYQTIFLPLQKNALLVQALLAQSALAANAGTPQAIAPMQVVDQFHKALLAPSPIGQEEAIGSYQKFVLNLLENASRNPDLAANPQVRKEVRAIVDDVNTWFDNNKDIFPGMKETYINGGLNLRAGISFGQADLLARGKQQFIDALETAPTRLEFISVLIQLAKVQNDMASLEKWGKQAELYRPDLFNLAEEKKTLGR